MKKTGNVLGVKITIPGHGHASGIAAASFGEDTTDSPPERDAGMKKINKNLLNYQ